MTRFLPLIVLVLITGLARPAAADASFDCAKASAPVEYMICNDPELVRLDGALGEAYTAKRGALPAAAAETLTRQQREWLKQRLDACGVAAKGPRPAREQRWAAAGCLAGQYRARLAALGAPDATPVPVPVSQPGFIHPLCLDEALGQVMGDKAPPPPPVPLAACNRGYAHVPVSRTGAGWIGVNNSLEGYSGYVAYKPAGRLPDGREVVILLENGGGTGQFTFLAALKRTGAAGAETLTGAVLTEGGDRCDGGIEEATVEGNSLVIDTNATVAAFIDASKIKLGDALAPAVANMDCAVCCLGTLKTRVPAGGGAGTLLSASITEADGLTTLAESDPLGACIAKALRKQAPTFPHTFSTRDLADLTREVGATCRAN